MPVSVKEVEASSEGTCHSHAQVPSILSRWWLALNHLPKVVHPSAMRATAPGGPLVTAYMVLDAMVDRRWGVKAILDGILNRFGD
ncbi:hypothetical protein GUJ93_ZPchr0001g32197 [Zizania palustris]|uniref:Uncharacterized protein n=1 Tax=Zizania palustris TaxID=103762 RepID=A0A8J5RMN1_ZIZPA|nr:hypothetical protein GUJ93_ZPchr0001g32197 [Zizania palustris]